MDHRQDILDEAALLQSAQTADVIRRFNLVFLEHDPAGLPDLVADNCTIENTTPAPDGANHVGKAACVALWQGIATAPGTHFDLEEVVIAGEHATIRWRYWWGPREAESVRGVNLMKVSNGLIVAAMGYVKGA